MKLGRGSNLPFQSGLLLSDIPAARRKATAKRQEHVSSIRIRVDAVADSGCDVNGKNDVDHSHNNLHNKLYHGHECRDAEEGKDMVVRRNHGGGGKEMLPQ